MLVYVPHNTPRDASTRTQHDARSDALHGAAIPMLDLRSEAAEIWSELQPAVERVLRNGQFIGGAEVEAFEAEAAAMLGVDHAVGLNSGTDALLLGLEAVGVGAGDEVITTPFSFFATTEAVLRLGATPIFVDVDDRTLNLDPNLLETAFTERTKAVLPVHIFGLPANLTPMMALAEQHGVALLEDCAQAFGASHLGRPVGSVGAVGAFSFYPTKNLGAYGDAGLATTNDPDLDALLRSLRNHGSSPDQKYLHDRLGYNSRLDALQAAILRVKLPRLAGWNARRRQRAFDYREALADVPQGDDALRLPPDDEAHVYHQFTLRLPEAKRERFEAELSRRGVSFARFYPAPLTQQPAGADFGVAPVAERACREVVSVPIHPWLPDEAIELVAAAALTAVTGDG